MRYPLGSAGLRSCRVPMAAFAAASRPALRRLRGWMLVACGACAFGSSGPALAQAPAGAEPTEEEVLEQIEPGTASVEEVARQLSNPVSSVWNLVVQNNYSLNKGDISSSHRGQWVTTFQPVLPLRLTEDWNLITRPVLPIVSAPIPQLDGSVDRENGLGDVALMSLLSPANPRGLIWGAGPSFLFPSATLRDLGSEHWSLGPAAVGLVLTQKWVLGALVQQWWSYAGDDDRRDVSLLNLQYFLYRFLPNRWQVGLGSPVISANWKAPSGDRWTVPIGLGVAKTFLIGRMPFQVGFEASYAVVHPDTFGQRWNFRLQFKPVVPALIQKPLFGR